MEPLKIEFLEKNFLKYPETLDAFTYFQECLEDLSIDGMAPLTDLLEIDVNKEKKHLKRGHRRDRIRVYFANFGHPSVQWLGGGISFEDGTLKPNLYFYMDSKASDVISSLCAALPGKEYLAEPSAKNRQVNICFQKNPIVKSLKELQDRAHELSSGVAKALAKAMP